MFDLADDGFATRRQTALFDDLLALFLAEGFSHLTLDDIAARLRCSKSTLYTLAGSKDELVRRVTIHFFKRATNAVEAILEQTRSERIAAYLTAVGEELAVASDVFMADLNAFAPAREVYEANTRAAAQRVRELIEEGVGNGAYRQVHASFAADLVATIMVRIQQREVRTATGLSDAEAYAELATLLTYGLRA
ncbi:TetR/AcrR family transcriptional regulator [Mycolicibacterium fluoranthenivorans]|jgi:AcrR family transcriptional regulator|uniref:TetR/AcrR family transcriptional regulator n=1 Tax=Mycolicibacterium fluoranthenivorans TaxID=258505 RepID=A0A1G4WII0_9MYCO|nr:MULTISPECIES: TetR/AcrR family transcriptional regulator [Mycobacteriaceae]MCV7253169.1 TetR/AcrR family transcriptional regulator [Mycobacterium hackensackense]QNJ93654.1 TetR/AcrR family transcriptional regulator [Mycolicibacterium fluoranthenivorans]SCX23654.1 transcriptional regulator, TetR family [Mycolicibacterium fluoranthenivorans]